MKQEIRCIGIDDSPFDKFNDKEVTVVGSIFRGGSFMDGIISTKATVDGNDATEKIIEMINKSKFKSLLQFIFLDGIAVGGFNVVDIKELHEKTGIPVIVVVRRKPDLEEIKHTLLRLKKENKISLVDKAGPVQKVNKIYVQFLGTTLGKVQEALKITCTHSLIPEPVRVAHLIAAGITRGESRGKA
ncbi:MAG: DUF99 family protein [Candidatus Woesearchaeota archaeon]